MIKRLNKKGVSAIVETVILVALVVGLTAIVWLVVNNMVNDELKGAKSCFGNFDKVTINNRYTCQDTTLKYANVSISVGDINVTEIVVSVLGAGEQKSFRLNGEDSYEYIKNFADKVEDASYNKALKLPGNNEGKTYTIKLGTGEGTIEMESIDSIKIAPVIGEEQCDVSDTIYSIDNCKSLI